MPEVLQQIQPISVRSLHRGMAAERTVQDALMPTSQVRLITNMHPVSIGQLIRIDGYTNVETGANGTVGDANPILGLQYKESTTAANERFLTFNNATASGLAESYYLDASSIWTLKTLSFTASLKIHTAVFLDYVFATNGTDNPRSWIGTTGGAWGATNLTSAPLGKFIAAFRQQLFIVSTTTVNFSSIPTAGAITWSASDNFQVNPNDSSEITAVVVLNREMLIFKDKYLYRYNGRALDVDPMIAYGTPTQECTTVLGGTCFFYDDYRRQVLAYSGGYPIDVSKPIASLLKSLATGSRAGFLMRSGLDFIEFLPNATMSIDEVTYTIDGFRYYPTTQTWVGVDYQHSFTFQTVQKGGVVYAGASNGTVMKLDTGNNFASGTGLTTVPINFGLETQWYTPTGDPRDLCRLIDLAFFVDNASSIQSAYKVDTDSQWRSLQSTKRFYNEAKGINADFHRVKFKFDGYSDAAPVIFDGFTAGMLNFGETPDTTNQIM